MKIEVFTHKHTFGSNMYILTVGEEAAVIDPSVDYNEVKNILKGNLEYIIVTHAHFDHSLAIDSWVQNTDAEVIVGRGDAAALADATLNCYLSFYGQNKGYYGPYRAVYEGETLKLSDKALRILETPGHSIGSISVLTDGAVFVGDVVFAGGGYGRVDLPHGDFSTLLASIRKLRNLDGNIKVYSGHGAPTDVFEIQQNFI